MVKSLCKETWLAGVALRSEAGSGPLGGGAEEAPAFRGEHTCASVPRQRWPLTAVPLKPQPGTDAQGCAGATWSGAGSAFRLSGEQAGCWPQQVRVGLARLRCLSSSPPLWTRRQQLPGESSREGPPSPTLLYHWAGFLMLKSPTSLPLSCVPASVPPTFSDRSGTCSYHPLIISLATRAGTCPVLSFKAPRPAHLLPAPEEGSACTESRGLSCLQNVNSRYLFFRFCFNHRPPWPDVHTYRFPALRFEDVCGPSLRLLKLFRPERVLCVVRFFPLLRS